ncbi:decaprenyl-diphosphate synthase subunit 1 [Cyathus striatus]|nr:decaprenyl-diphosphate synthase subunit 1 [Cyathus striatus]
MHKPCIPTVRSFFARRQHFSRGRIRHNSTTTTDAFTQHDTQPPNASAQSSPAPAPAPAPSEKRVDPIKLLSPHLAEIRQSLIPLLASGHPALSEITKYYFLHPSKQIRPVIILLFSLATNGLGGDWNKKLWEAGCAGGGGCADELDRPLTRPDVLNDWNPQMADNTSSFQSAFPLKPPKAHRHPSVEYTATSTSTPALHDPTLVLPTQKRLAQIVEMLHTASLLHDDVIDESALRRGAPSAPSAFGNKLSVLGGNFVLGRASAALSRLGDPEVTELIASVLSNLVEGEILQTKEVTMNGEVAGQARKDAWNIYLQKTYLKTASLMAKGARSAVVLGGCKEGEVWKEIAYAYGRNLGIAFQLVDDVLDYESASATLGKPGGADLQLGLATGPALYAWEEHPELGELIQRKFEKPGDVEMARDYVLRSQGVQRTRELAQAYAVGAKEALQRLPDSEAKQGLEVLTERVIGRKS